MKVLFCKKEVKNAIIKCLILHMKMLLQVELRNVAKLLIHLYSAVRVAALC